MARPKSNETNPDGKTQTALPNDYQVRLALARLREVEENSERLALDNCKKRIDLQKTNCNLCYLDVAEDTVNKALVPIANILKSLDQILATRLNLSGAQTEILQDEIGSILSQIAAIEIHIQSTEETDAERSHASTVERESAIREAAKSRKKHDRK